MTSPSPLSWGPSACIAITEAGYTSPTLAPTRALPHAGTPAWAHLHVGDSPLALVILTQEEDPAARGAISRSRAQSVRGPEDLEPASTSTFARRQCVQRALKKALGFDYNEKYYVMGCNTPAMTDFDHWAKETGCGSEPVDGNLL